MKKLLIPLILFGAWFIEKQFWQEIVGVANIHGTASQATAGVLVGLDAFLMTLVAIGTLAAVAWSLE